MRTAKAVGAETATIIGPPMAADFCTISTETRLVSTIMPWRGVAPLVHKRTGKLIQRVVATNILPHGYQATCWVPETCGVYRTGLLVKCLLRKERVYAVMI